MRWQMKKFGAPTLHQNTSETLSRGGGSLGESRVMHSASDGEESSSPEWEGTVPCTEFSRDGGSEVSTEQLLSIEQFDSSLDGLGVAMAVHLCCGNSSAKK